MWHLVEQLLDFVHHPPTRVSAEEGIPRDGITLGVIYCPKAHDILCQAHVSVKSRSKCGSLYSLRCELRGIRKKNISVLP
jgi:hypothetical protein